MTRESIHQPNDKLLKATFSVPENARAFFQSHLTSELADALNWDLRSLEPSSFIAPQFASSESDLLFHIQLYEREAYLYLLFEHRSSEDPRMALRLRSYIVCIWERFTHNHIPPTKLLAILSLYQALPAMGKAVYQVITHDVSLRMQSAHALY